MSTIHSGLKTRGPEKNRLARLVVAGLSVLLAGVAVTAWRLGAPLGVDSGVYRAGALAVLHGDPLYGSLRFLPHWSGGLPFTYPPVAAVVFLPLAALPAQLGWGLLAVASVLGLAVALRTSLKGSGIGSRTWLLPVAGIGALVLEPVWRGLGLGQVNVALMALVILDVLVLKRSRRGGILVGLAAAIKLTPLIFVLHLLVTGRRADAARALGTFAGLNVVCAMLMPADTLRYWRAQLLGGDGATSSSWAGNQSLNGMIQRFTDHASWAFALSIVAGLLCLALALPMARTLYRRGEHLGALLVSAFCGLLISPISWTHHWVWVVPLFGLLATRALRAPSVSTLAPLIGLVAIFTGFTVPMMPAGGDLELRWTPIQMVLGNAYVLAALVAGGILAGRLLRSRTTVSVTTVRERRSAPAFGADPVAAALVPINRVSGTP